MRAHYLIAIRDVMAEKDAGGKCLKDASIPYATNTVHVRMTSYNHFI